MGEGIGHYDMLIAKRQSLVGRLSDNAKHNAFPKLYARPIPREATVIADPTPPLREEIARLKSKVAGLEQENARLNILVTELQKPLAKREKIEISTVMEAFTMALATAQRFIEGRPHTIDDLKAVSRTRTYSEPRQVCMWLVRKICLHTSIAAIGRSFGDKDHTTVIHACRRAPEIMEADPGLRAVARAVLRTFGAPEALLGETA